MASETSEAAASGPSLRIEALHIEKLRAIRRLDWPGDGPGWGGSVPDMVLVGGANGSGKTTLLDFIASALSILWNLKPSVDWLAEDEGVALRIDFSITSNETGNLQLRFLFGDTSFVARHGSDRSYGVIRHKGSVSGFGHDNATISRIRKLATAKRLDQLSLPGLIYIPSRARSLVVPRAKLKTAGKRQEPFNIVHQWTPPGQWETSLEALLYSARWEDLNAKDEGRPQDAHHFDSFARAYEAFFGPEKRLTWHKGELFVEIVETGALHDLSGLSSGEQQIIVLVSELLDRWRPGSLILIDEPELHLHVSWQLALWDALKRWRAERGGQVIATTQSSELFGYSEPGTNVILGGRAL